MKDNINDKMKININNNNNKIIRTKDNNINNLNTSKNHLPRFRIAKNIPTLKAHHKVCFQGLNIEVKPKKGSWQL